MEDTQSSAQGISSQAINPYGRNQALLYNNQAGGFQGGINPLLASLYAGNGGGLGGYNQGLGQLGGLGGYGNAFGGNQFAGGLGGLNGYGQNPYLQLGGGLGGLQGASAYQNPYLASNIALSGAAAGINPLLLSGARNAQYPVGVGLGGTNPYLTQSLLSPYSQYSQINPYSSFPFSSRFGIGLSRNRGAVGGSLGNNNSNRNAYRSGSTDDE